MAARTNCLVILREGEPIEGALKRFKTGLLKLGLFRELKARAMYVRPGQRRRLKSKHARARVRKAEMKSAARSEWMQRQVQDMKKRKGVI